MKCVLINDHARKNVSEAKERLERNYFLSDSATSGTAAALARRTPTVACGAPPGRGPTGPTWGTRGSGDTAGRSVQETGKGKIL